MNKDELIKFKEKLVNQATNMKYGYFDPTSDSVYPETTKFVDEIISEINIQKTMEKIELLIENFIKHLVANGKDFSKITLQIPNDLYVSEYFINKCYNDDNFNEERPITKKDVLYDVIPLSINFNAYDNNDKVINLDYEDEFAPIISIGIVKYNEFVKCLKLLGYDISIENFDEYFDNMNDWDNIPEIVIDFSKEKEHKH